MQLYGAKVATSAAKLPTCDSNQVGQLFYVLDDEKFQFCSSEGYQSIDLNGDSGADGKNGANGKDGADGSSCTISDDNAGTLTQTCTDGTSASWPKALCGTKPYDPATHFCEAGTTTPMLSWSAHCLVPGNCGTFSDSRETPAKQYKWTKIGTQTWMAENQTHRLPRPSTMYTITMVKVWQQLRLAATTQTMECCTTGQQPWLLALQAGICPALGILQRYIQMWVESKRLVPN